MRTVLSDGAEASIVFASFGELALGPNLCLPLPRQGIHDDLLVAMSRELRDGFGLAKV